MSTKNRILRAALWAAVVASPLISIALIGLASGTSPFALDAWNTSMNDERSYYWAIVQMRAFGEPSGFAGYNEQTAEFLSYGPYNLFVYVPYYLASYLMPLESHNFMYYINIGFGVVSAALLVALTKPDLRQSMLLLCFMLLGFPTARYLCSGMSEGSYLLFGALAIGLALFVYRRDRAGGTRDAGHVQGTENAQGTGGTQGAHAGGIIKSGACGHAARNAASCAPDRAALAALCILIIATCFWGCMRPYLFAFILLPCVLVFTCDFGYKGMRMKLAVLAFAGVAVIASLAFYVYYANSYVTPYFNEPNIGASIGSRLIEALPGLAAKHVECFAYSAAKLVHLRWQGIAVFSFAVCWIALVFILVDALRARHRNRACLAGALVLIGLAVFEAHLLLYTYVQMHRTLIAVSFAFAVAIICLTGSTTQLAPRRRAAATVFAICLLCSASLLVDPGNFALPQADASITEQADRDARSELEHALPCSSDHWDNTIAKLVEVDGQRIYFNMPRYLTTNGCTRGYMEKAIRKHSFRSKYVCLALDHELNKPMRAQFPLVYEGQGHAIYQVRK